MGTQPTDNFSNDRSVWNSPLSLAGNLSSSFALPKIQIQITNFARNYFIDNSRSELKPDAFDLDSLDRLLDDTSLQIEGMSITSYMIRSAVDLLIASQVKESEDVKRTFPVSSDTSSSLWNLEFLAEPGHDLRHVLFRDPLTEILQKQERNLSNAEEFIAFVGCLMHDSGRLIERAVTGTSVGGVQGDVHTELSFFLLAELKEHMLDKLEIEGITDSQREHLSKLFDYIQATVLVHQSGKCREDLPCQVVQSADRLQLIGNEMLYRAFVFDVGIQGAQIFPGEGVNTPISDLPLPGVDPENYNFFTHCEFYLRNLYPIAGNQEVQDIVTLKKQESIKFMTRATLGSCDRRCVRSELKKPFEEINYDFKRLFLPEILEARKKLGLDNPDIEETPKFKTPIDVDIFLTSFPSVDLGMKELGDSSIDIDNLLSHLQKVRFATNLTLASNTEGVTVEDNLRARLEEDSGKDSFDRFTKAFLLSLKTLEESDMELLEKLNRDLEENPPYYSEFLNSVVSLDRRLHS